MALQEEKSKQKECAETPTAPSISLPKGGGTIRGIGEKFAANPITGTDSMSVPIATSPDWSRFGPQLSLSYVSGSGNGPFGFGWSLSLPSITRKTDKGLPQYRDAEESDIYILSGDEVLVQILQPDGTRFKGDTTIPNFVIHHYRPDIEGLFTRIDQWTKVATGKIHWRSITRLNVTALYGKDNNSRIFGPGDQPAANPTRVFNRIFFASYDDKSNSVLYEYAAENDDFDYDETHHEEITLDPSKPEADQHRFGLTSVLPDLSWDARGRGRKVRPGTFSSHDVGSRCVPIRDASCPDVSSRYRLPIGKKGLPLIGAIHHIILHRKPYYVFHYKCQLVRILPLADPGPSRPIYQEVVSAFEI